MSHYSTGEIAQLCQVTIRTVQFYDQKGLLKPSALSEGGRRLYSDEDIKHLSMICLLKSLGLSLKDIKNVLESRLSTKVVLALLDQLEASITSEIETKQTQLNTIRILKEKIENTKTLPVNSLSDIEDIMQNNDRKKKTHRSMLILGLTMNILEIGTIILWIRNGIWLPFVLTLPIILLLGLRMVMMYYKTVVYICPECNKQFKPPLGRFIFSKHTPKLRKLTCPKCETTDYCIEHTQGDKK